MTFSDDDLAQTLVAFDAMHSDMVALGHRIGPGGVRAVCDVFGGRKVHVPEFDNFVLALRRTMRDEEIRRKFRGNNLHELAFEYGMSARHVHRVLHGDRAPRAARRERTRGLRCAHAVYDAIVELARANGLGVRETVDAVLRAGLVAPDLHERLAGSRAEVAPLFAARV